MRVIRKYFKAPLTKNGFGISINVIESKEEEVQFYSYKNKDGKMVFSMNLSYDQAKQIHAAIEKALYYE